MNLERRWSSFFKNNSQRWHWQSTSTQIFGISCRLSLQSIGLESSKMSQKLCASSLTSWVEVINSCWKRSLPASYMRWHNAKSVEMWKFGRKPSQTLWYQCLQPRKSKTSLAVGTGTRDGLRANNSEALGGAAQVWGVGCWMLGELRGLPKKDSSRKMEWNCISSSTPLFVLESIYL